MTDFGRLSPFIFIAFILLMGLFQIYGWVSCKMKERELARKRKGWEQEINRELAVLKSSKSSGLFFSGTLSADDVGLRERRCRPKGWLSRLRRKERFVENVRN